MLLQEAPIDHSLPWPSVTGPQILACSDWVDLTPGIRHSVPAQHWLPAIISLSKHMGDGKVKLGRGPYAISTAILSMYAGF